MDHSRIARRQWCCGRLTAVAVLPSRADRWWRRWAVLMGVALVLMFSALPVQAAVEGAVRIGVLAHRGETRALEQWTPTAEFLNARIGQYRFEIVPLDFDAVAPAVRDGAVDFLIANSAYFAELDIRYRLSPIATLRNQHDGEGVAHFGGVIFCRDDHPTIVTLADLKGARFMAVDPGSFGGWYVGWLEMQRQGLKVPGSFAELKFGGTHDAVVLAVRDGVADAGTVRTDTLERMAQEGTIALDRFRILNAQAPTAEFHLQRSTPLYPEWPFAKLAHTPDHVARLVAAALITMPSDTAAALAARCAGWTTPHSYQSVHDCLRELRTGPYEGYGAFTPADVWRQYHLWLIGIALLAGLLGVTALHARRLNTVARRQQQHLQDSDAFLRTAIDALSHPFAVINADTHIIEMANAAYGGAAVVGQACHRVSHRQETPCTGASHPCPLLQVRETGRPAVVQHVHYDSEGALRDIAVYAHPILDAAGRTVRIIEHAIDITERNQAERALKRGAAFEGLIGRISSDFARIDPEGTDAAVARTLATIGTFAGVDRAYIFRFSDDGCCMDNTHEWCAEGVAPQIDRLRNLPVADTMPWLAPRLLAGETVSIPHVAAMPPEARQERDLFEAQAIRSLLIVPTHSSDGIVGFLGFDAVQLNCDWPDDTPRLLRFVGEIIAHTIEKQRVHKALREREERLNLMLEGTDEGLWDWDVVQNQLWFNDHWVRMLGYVPGERVFDYHWWRDHVHPDSLSVIETAMAAYLAGRHKYYEFEYQLRAKCGQWRWVWARGVCVGYDADNQPLRIIGTQRDITERKAAEMQRQETNRHLATATARANELAQKAEMANIAKSQFLANMSHEIR
ncbi:MAG: PhnD/SsuA/transferrin family substrate-binding protein, partial [Desulfatitalea sp.]|nr:PhnD/SsuA/transferrin family substrate-binding protein [Desulfatitalea sp.]